MKKHIGHILFVLTVLISQQSFSQSLTGTAFELYKAKDYRNAMVWIDSAVQTNERYDSQTWQLRGIIYRKTVGGDDELYFREIALESFIRAQTADSTGVYKTKIEDYLKNTVILYYNDAVTLMKTDKDFESSQESYLTYKDQYHKLIDPTFDFSSSDITYYNALGADYLSLVTAVNDDQKEKIRIKSMESCEMVIQIDSMNFQANLNIGLLNYNQGADYVTKADPFMTIEDIMYNQEKSKVSFLKAIPYLKRAERINPTDKKVLIALMSCYYGLHKNDLYIKYQTMVDKMDIDGLEEKHRTNPKDVEVIKELIRIYTNTLIAEKKSKYYKKLLNDLNP